MEPAFSAEASGSMPSHPPPKKDESSSSKASTSAREAEDTVATAVAMATSDDSKKKPRTWKDELIEPECQFCRDTRAALMGLVKGTAGAAGGAADRGIDAATGVAGSVRKETRAARKRVERFVSTGVAHAADAEERAFEALKGREGNRREKEEKRGREKRAGHRKSIDRSMVVASPPPRAALSAESVPASGAVAALSKLPKLSTPPSLNLPNRLDQVSKGERALNLRRSPADYSSDPRPSTASGPVASDLWQVPLPRGRARLCRLARRGGGRGNGPRQQRSQRGLGRSRGGPGEAGRGQCGRRGAGAGAAVAGGEGGRGAAGRGLGLGRLKVPAGGRGCTPVPR